MRRLRRDWRLPKWLWGRGERPKPVFSQKKQILQKWKCLFTMCSKCTQMIGKHPNSTDTQSTKDYAGVTKRIITTNEFYNYINLYKNTAKPIKINDRVRQKNKQWWIKAQKFQRWDFCSDRPWGVFAVDTLEFSDVNVSLLLQFLQFQLKVRIFLFKRRLSEFHDFILFVILWHGQSEQNNHDRNTNAFLILLVSQFQTSDILIKYNALEHETTTHQIAFQIIWWAKPEYWPIRTWSQRLRTKFKHWT